MLRIKKISLALVMENGTQSLNFKEKTINSGEERYYFSAKEERINACVSIESENGVTTGKVSVYIDNYPILENYNLAAQSPILISLTFDEIPVHLCAAYQQRDWWSRPAFINTFEDIPQRTQALFLEGEKSYGFFLPMVGNKTKTYITRGTKTTLSLEMTAYTGGINQVDDLCFVLSEGNDLYKSIEEVFAKACSLKNIPMRKDRKYPEIFEYFGWCSWDAFYTNISEEKVLQKVKELKEKNIPVRWILMDDGWLNIKDQCLTSFKPDPDKFPNEFKILNKTIKDETKITWIGVWHALGGYWNGIHPESDLAKDMKNYLYETKNGKLLPHYNPEKGYKFWSNWYTYLKEQGIDFVKVDGQSALKNYYKNNEEIAKVAAGTHIALETAVSKFMNGNIINCMGMAMENILSRPATCISRNSDDFVPKEEHCFCEHLLQNAYNGLYHDNVYVCDWDMYWTSHPDAKRHALLRAISGGPVYISDPIGKSIYEEIMPLIYHDGRLLRMDRCAKPALDCIFQSPLDNRVLKLTNTVNGTGAIAAFHISETEQSIKVHVSPSDIYDLEGDVFGAFEFFTKTFIILNKEEKVSLHLEKGGYELVLFIPIKDMITPIGLIDKYMSPHAVDSIKTVDDKLIICVKEGGIFAFYSKKPPKYIFANDIEMTEKLVAEEGFYSIDLCGFKEKVYIAIEV